MAPKAERSINQTIRRNQLRQLVPLADSTIYEMEQRGEFPRIPPVRAALWGAG
jgi:prophage regulatory protein